MEKNNAKLRSKDDIKGSHLLPEGVTLEELKSYWEIAENEYLPIRKRMFLLDGADRSQLWKTITAKFPSYQVLPETNHVNYIKENLLNSIYVVGKVATLIPRVEAQIPVVNQLNQVYGKIWSILGVPTYQRKAGERAALLNIGITQVGWKSSIVGGATNYLYKGDVVLKNIDPQKFMRDPFADTADNAKYQITFDDYHISTLKSTPIYKERIAELEKALGSDLGAEDTQLSFEDTTDRAKSGRSNKKYHRVVSYWVRLDDGSIAEIHLLNNQYVLYVNKNEFSKLFPFAILHCNEPGNDIIGVSEPAKAFSNYIAYNMLNSIVATHAYKAQRPPRFVNVASGINLRQFAKYGADADKTWPVNGDASMAVHYGKFPDLPGSIDSSVGRMEYDIKDKSGIDAQYAGKDMGSVTTTGGANEVTDRTTARDNVKVQLYEEYTKRLSALIMQFYIRYGDKRVFAVRDETSNTVHDVTVNFKEIANDSSFDYDLSIQSELPKTKSRVANLANMLLEKQAQYKMSPEIITNEEWLMLQDLPFKDLIFSRIGIQRNNNKTEEVTATLFKFAGLIQEGVPAEQALQMVTDSLTEGATPDASLQAMGTDPMAGGGSPLGNTPNANSFQERQAM